MRIWLILFALLFSSALIAQNKLTIIKLAPPSGELISENVKSQLENKLKQILSANGIANGNSTQFLLASQFNLNDRAVVEGLQKMTVVKFDMNLQLTNWVSGDGFVAESIIITGSGSSDIEAFRNAISKIKPSDVRLKKFLEDSSVKIQQYYQNECINLMLEADKLANTKSYVPALAILASIPQDVGCYNEANEKKEVLYHKYQQEFCNQKLQQAKVYAANNNYRMALYYLGQIDRASTCIKESDDLMTKIGAEVDAENKKEWEKIMKSQESGVEGDKVRAEILDKILESHYRQK